MIMLTQLLQGGIAEALEVFSGLTLWAVLLVLALVLFFGPFIFARKHDLGTAHAVGAGIGGLGFVFLFLIMLQLIHSPI